MKLSELLMPRDECPDNILAVYGDYLEQNPESTVYVGKAQRWFIVDVTNGEVVLWGTPNVSISYSDLIQTLKEYSPNITYRTHVSQHTNSGGYKTPRLYLDKGLMDAGYKGGEEVEVELNKLTGEINIRRRQ